MMKMLCSAVTAILVSVCAPGHAQDHYPSRPVTVVVPFGSGSGSDAITRLITEKMARNMNAIIVIDNRAGASGQIGTEFVARAKPDGYTLLVATNSTHSAMPYLYKSLRYDPVGFTPIGVMTTNPLALLVRPNSPFRTTEQLVRFARENPEKLSYGYGNTSGQVSAAMLTNLSKVKALSVPYKTTPQILTDLLGGQVDFTFVDVAAAKPLIDSGKVRALAVTGATRFPALPSVPALRETAGLEDFRVLAWVGLVGPQNLPKPIVDKLNAELRAALTSPEVKEKLENSFGSIVEPTSVAEFNTFMTEQRALWKRRINEAGIQPE